MCLLALFPTTESWTPQFVSFAPTRENEREQKEGKKPYLTGTHHVLKCFSAVQERVDGQANISTLQFWMLKTYPFSTFLLLLEQPAEQTHHRLNKASTQVKLSAQQDPL